MKIPPKTQHYPCESQDRWSFFKLCLPQRVLFEIGLVYVVVELYIENVTALLTAVMRDEGQTALVVETSIEHFALVVYSLKPDADMVPLLLRLQRQRRLVGYIIHNNHRLVGMHQLDKALGVAHLDLRKHSIAMNQ